MPQIINLTKKYGYKPVFSDFSIEFPQNEVTAVLGKSGVGKSTLLNCIADLTDYQGDIQGFGKVAYVFQEPRLVPFMTVEENLRFVLDGVLEDKAAVSAAIFDVLSKTRLLSLKDRVADTLSGGEKQRVALARAFSYPADTILLDEPFNSLDMGLKQAIMQDFKTYYAAFSKTCVFVTHSVDEALFLAKRIIYLDGKDKICFDNPTPSSTFGFEENVSLRKKLYETLFSSDDNRATISS